MPAAKAPTRRPKGLPKASSDGPPGGSIAEQVRWVLGWLEAHSSKAIRDGMARYAIPSHNAIGVAMKDLKALGKQIGHRHELALALWKTGGYEARMLTSFIADPARITSAQMDRWCADFDSWALCDGHSFNLFDRTPHAWAKVEAWSRKRGEFEKRTAFALLWSLALHDKDAGDERFLHGLTLIERAADDDRNFVKKAIDMALRAVARRSPKVQAAAIAVATRLTAASPASARWIGSHALREMQRRGPPKARPKG